jgi:hypothetical protein
MESLISLLESHGTRVARVREGFLVVESSYRTVGGRTVNTFDVVTATLADVRRFLGY